MGSGRGRDRNAACPDLLQQDVDALRVEAEFVAVQDFLILDEDSRVVTED